tara:strand:+ start:3562 stop:5226 length:1665 start_codon:yes stop_codon:yes gene_type:complete
MIQKCYVNIILIFLFIIIIFNLFNLFKKNETLEQFRIERNQLDYLQEQIESISSNIDNLDSGIRENEPRTKTLMDSTMTLFDDINTDTNELGGKYDENYDIIRNYNPTKNLKCLNGDLKKTYQTLTNCSDLCNKDDNCLSFSHDKTNNECILSTFCHPKTNSTTKKFNNTLYIKKISDDITNYTMSENQECNNLCYDDIINEQIGSGGNGGYTSITNDVHVCALESSNNPKAVSFEYNFDDSKCTLRKQCKQGKHLKNSNEYVCDKGQPNTSATILKEIIFEKDPLRIITDLSLDKYSLYNLNSKCKEKCDENKEACEGYSYEFSNDKNICNLYSKIDINNLNKDLQTPFINICKKPRQMIKHLYTKKIQPGKFGSDIVPDENAACSAVSFCEKQINDNVPFIKFFYNRNDVNYSYITFTDMYNIKYIEDFDLTNYEYISIKFGNGVEFLNSDSSLSFKREFKNPDEYNLRTADLKFDIKGDWKNKINVIKINKLLADDMCKYTITACDGSVQTFKLNGDDFYSKDDRKVRVDMCRTANRLGDFNKNDEKPCFN